jgi:hypothetical protein
VGGQSDTSAWSREKRGSGQATQQKARTCVADISADAHRVAPLHLQGTKLTIELHNEDAGLQVQENRKGLRLAAIDVVEVGVHYLRV